MAGWETLIFLVEDRGAQVSGREGEKENKWYRLRVCHFAIYDLPANMYVKLFLSAEVLLNKQTKINT